MEIMAQTLIAWMSMNRQDIPGFEHYADMMSDKMMKHLPQGQYNPLANVTMLHGPAAQVEGMDSELTSPALQPRVPSAQEMEQDPNSLPPPHFQSQKTAAIYQPTSAVTRDELEQLNQLAMRTGVADAPE